MSLQERMIENLKRILDRVSNGKEIEHDDLIFVRNNIEVLKTCNKEVLRKFINNMLLVDDIALSLKVLSKSGILFYAFEELEKLVGLQQPSKYHDYDAFGHTIEAVKYSEKDLAIRLAMLLHDVGKPLCYHKDENGKITFYGHGVKGEKIAYKLLKDLGYDKNLIEEVCLYVKHHMDYAPTEKSFNKMLKELGNDIDKVDKLLKVKLYDSYASKGMDDELADIARNNDEQYRKILGKYKR